MRKGVDDDLLLLLLDGDISMAKTDWSANFTAVGVDCSDVVVVGVVVIESEPGNLNKRGRGLGRGVTDWMTTTGGLWRTLGGSSLSGNTVAMSVSVVNMGADPTGTACWGPTVVGVGGGGGVSLCPRRIHTTSGFSLTLSNVRECVLLQECLRRIFSHVSRRRTFSLFLAAPVSSTSDESHYMCKHQT